MHHDRVIVRIELPVKGCEGPSLRIGVGVLFAQVPDECRVMREAGNQLPVEQLSIRTEFAPIEQLIVFLLLGFGAGILNMARAANRVPPAQERLGSNPPPKAAHDDEEED